MTIHRRAYYTGQLRYINLETPVLEGFETSRNGTRVPLSYIPALEAESYARRLHFVAPF
jgi:hypothetical protein